MTEQQSKGASVSSWGGSPTSFFNSKYWLFTRWRRAQKTIKLELIIRDEAGYPYHENGSKNRKDTFRERNISNKVVQSYAVPEVGEQCHVHILDVYICMLSKDAYSMGAFYFWPLSKPLQEGPWYAAVPI